MKVVELLNWCDSTFVLGSALIPFWSHCWARPAGMAEYTGLSDPCVGTSFVVQAIW